MFPEEVNRPPDHNLAVADNVTSRDEPMAHGGRGAQAFRLLADGQPVAGCIRTPGISTAELDLELIEFCNVTGRSFSSKA